jgi:hypothetical protein
MCNIGAERMRMGIIIVLNKFSISVASWGYFQRQLPMQVVLEYTKFGCW